MGDELKMTLARLKVLAALRAEPDKEHYGFEISRQTGLMSGTLYPILMQFEKHGLVNSSWEDIDPKIAGRGARRFYRLSAIGLKRAQLEAEAAQRGFAPIGIAGAGL